MTRRRESSDPNDEKVAVFLPRELKLRLQVRALRERRTMSELVVDAIRAFLAPMRRPRQLHRDEQEQGHVKEPASEPPPGRPRAVTLQDEEV